MRSDLDYREYDPERFSFDHQDDPVILHARENAQILRASLTGAQIDGEPHEKRQHIDQGFDMLQNDLWDRLDLVNKNERYQALEDFRNERRAEATQRGQAVVNRADDRDGQVAAWEGTPLELNRINRITLAEARAHSPALNKKMEQLEQYQSARNEAASNEVDRYRYQTLRERGVHEAQPPERGREASPPVDSAVHKVNDPNNPSDVATMGAEAADQKARLARLQEAHKLVGTPADQANGREKTGPER